MTIDDVVEKSQELNLQQIQFLYVDNGGAIRGKVSSLRSLKGHMVGGIGLTPAMQAMNIMDELQPVPGIGPVGEIRLMPDPDSFRILPYLPRTASMMTNMIGLNHEPWYLCPRSFLKRQVERAANLGYRVMATYENEFSLAQRTDNGNLVPIDDVLCFSSIGMARSHGIILDIMDALEAQRIHPEQYYPELGHGQHELSVAPTDVVEACDNQVRYRETVRTIAAQHGLVASFAPKPFVEQAGNGAHIHFSLWNQTFTHNLFWDPNDPYHLSSIGYQFGAGVLAHLPSLVALTCASVNSYRRLNPRSWSSAYTAFGPDNREAAVRIASTFWGNEERSINLELKSSDASANPYLALGSMLAAGLDGLERRLPPPPIVTVDPATLSEDEQVARHIVRLPSSLSQALDQFEQDNVLKKAMGESFARAYLMVKRSEVEHFSRHDAAYEINQYAHKY